MRAKREKISLRTAPAERVLIAGPVGASSVYGTVCALAIERGQEIHRIDLATIVSKYIGETEKNLAQLFRRAEDKQWILFFDEADALFGKRTNIRDAHDRYANLEINYLLDRLENFEGLAVFATNAGLKIDEALLRRFQRVIRPSKPAPKPKRRTANGRK